ncbi:MAG: hypothetical protein KAJ18_09980 [Candidatus Omnitrophica bacterium]|nr:hypothetical protein [Candidatus Omnitrophota bacterium]
MAKCFIIMPVTTPEAVAERYSDKHHFKHVLDCLFLPAVKKAKLEPVKPIASGSDMIHARIIKHLENADAVLCDMSILNPNVFFELGVRTALNKPVCLVRDDCTPTIPFDLTMLNCHQYSGALNSWELEAQIDKLCEHVKASVKNSDGKNTLWEVFGMKTTGEPYKPKEGIEGKIDLLTMQINALAKDRRRDDMRGKLLFNLRDQDCQPITASTGAALTKDIWRIANLCGMQSSFKCARMEGDRVVTVHLKERPPNNFIEQLRPLLHEANVRLQITCGIDTVCYGDSLD